MHERPGGDGEADEAADPGTGDTDEGRIPWPRIEVEGSDADPAETRDWLDSFDAIVERHGPDRARFLLERLLRQARIERVPSPALVQTPYVNTIAPEEEPPYPGDQAIELRIRRLVRWNAVAMVVRANHLFHGIGGHLATYASAATLYEVGFNHFFHGKDGEAAGDQVFFQGHASPGIYARALLEGRLAPADLEHFRREAGPARGLSSYPHPRLMPDFWEFPTVSMGLGPISAIYQARYNRYLHHRGIKDTSDSRVWAFLGDGETDEPESLGSLSIAAREGLDNLVFVVNCNLQRLDGPVRGNGKIIQELEAVFHGAGWNVIKVIWGAAWDPLLAADTNGRLVQRMGEVVDGEYQKYSVEPGAYTRAHFFGAHPDLFRLVEHLSDERIHRLRRGGHDAVKVHAAYWHAARTKGRPTAILAKTVKGWTLGAFAEGRNIAHQAKQVPRADLKAFRDELQLPIPDAALADGEMPFHLPDPRSPEIEYLRACRRRLGGPVPRRVVRPHPLPVPALDAFPRYTEGGGDAPASTTNVFARLLADLLRDPAIGSRLIPIVPDEARTFGLDALFKKHGIYSAVGQLYEPVDQKMLLSYREALDGQVLEEGITEAGAMASFTAAGTAYATHGEPTVPMYVFYSMFGFQRTGDQIWAAADARARGFLLGATAGRTTLSGEGLQHQDGHSLLLASTVPAVLAYEPAFAYEVAAIVLDGLRRLLTAEEDRIIYLTLQNEAYPMPPMPEGALPGILQGLYRFRPVPEDAGGPRTRVLGSGALINEALRAREMLADRYGVQAEVWSATSFLALRREALATERWNRLHPAEEARTPLVTRLLDETGGPVVAVTDSMRAVPHQIAPWVPGGVLALGTDGFGRSDTRAALRRRFEVDAEHVTAAVLAALARCDAFPRERAAAALRDLGIDPEAPDAGVVP